MIERLFEADHPASRGHFPGNPVIPGAVLLNVALRAIEASLGVDLAPVRITSAKFLRPARPGDRVLIEFTHSAGDEIRFTCAVGGRTVLTGQTCRVPSTAT